MADHERFFREIPSFPWLESGPRHSEFSIYYERNKP